MQLLHVGPGALPHAEGDAAGPGRHGALAGSLKHLGWQDKLTADCSLRSCAQVLYL